MNPIQIVGFSNPADVVNVVYSLAVGALPASEAVISVDPQGTNAMTKRYLEDFAVRQTFGSGRVRVDGERIKSFAAEFDPQPFHLDEEAARHTIFRGLAASGWHTAALTMRLLVEGESKPAGGIIGLGLDELRWPLPVRPGDELRVEGEVLEVSLSQSQSHPHHGLIKVRARTLNQNDEAVQVFVADLIVLRRNR
jgi:acyl dehydratase